ncbi:MAG: hypothetical protein ACN6PR_05090 [Achromobacter sp.]
MKKFLTTPGAEGYFDFLSLNVVLSKYEYQHLDNIQRAIAWKPGMPVDRLITDYRALIKHEITHFLDMTTTAWGRQYTLRKLQMLRQIIDKSTIPRDARAVFALCTAEIEMHSALLESGDTPPSSCDTIVHDLVDVKQFGVCIRIHYLKNGKCQHKVALSMLSLLEANATASEFLSLLQCADHEQDIVSRRLALADVQRRFDALLDDPTRLEYSSLLHLTRLHFKELDLAALLQLVSASARFSLDTPFPWLPTIASVVQRTFKNIDLGDRLAMELRRTSALQLIYFKTVLLLYQWLRDPPLEELPARETLLRERPYEAIVRMWEHYLKGELPGNREAWDWMNDRNLDAVAFQVRETGRPLPDEILFAAGLHNRKILATRSAGVIDFGELLLPDSLLADGVSVTYPNRVDLDVAKCCDENVNSYMDLDREYREMAHERFYLPPDSELIVRSKHV